MADTQENNLPLAGSILPTDYVRIVKDPGGTPISENVAFANVPTGPGATGNVLTSDGSKWTSATPTAPIPYVAPGTTGNILTSNGSNWVSLPSAGSYPFMSNGMISVTVASNNLTLALKNWLGNDPSSGNPVSVYLGGTQRTITAPLSVTVNAGTNTFNAGAAELKTQAIDYFAYLGWNSIDGITIGFSRIVGRSYGDFSATATNEKYCAISIITHAVAANEYAIIGRFEATNSGTASYNWSVPTYTPTNLVQYPIINTRRLTWTPGKVTIGIIFGATQFNVGMANYTITDQMCKIEIEVTGSTSGTTSSTICLTLPINATNYANWIAIPGAIIDGGIYPCAAGVGISSGPSANLLNFSKWDCSNWSIGTGKVLSASGEYYI